MARAGVADSRHIDLRYYALACTAIGLLPGFERPNGAARRTPARRSFLTSDCDYKWLISSSANSEHFTSVAPSISRAKS